MRIAQGFSPGISAEKNFKPAKRATDSDRSADSVARFTGSDISSTDDPSAEALGYFQTSANADELVASRSWFSKIRNC
jgi:hypothetical protein